MGRTDRKGAWLPSGRLWRRASWLCGGFLVLAVVAVVRYYVGPDDAQAQVGPRPVARTARIPARVPTPRGRQTVPPRQRFPDVVASVAGHHIGLNQLANHCLRYHADVVLEALVNRELIVQECRRRQLTITNQEIDGEIARMARRFNVPVDRYLALLADERDILPDQYRTDVVWPTVALKRLAADRLQVSEQELRELYEAQYGPAVRARLIVLGDRAAADRVRQQAAQNPGEFAALARQSSEDTASAAAGGIIPPIRLHMGDKNLEQAAFSLQPGAVSDVIPVGSKFVILKCDGRIPPRYAQFPLDARGRSADHQKAAMRLREQLVSRIREGKLRSVADDIFKELQKNSNVQIIYGNPEATAQLPGIAATINDQQITVLHLAEECVARHGKEVLDGMIDRKLLQLECQRRNLVITDPDLDEEIARAAVSMGKTDREGRPDISAWLEFVTQLNGLTIELYRYDVVWPSAALKKLVVDRVQVTEDDMQKGFEANYGPRVECRAMILGNLRMAQKVWEMARKNPTAEYFGALAEQYSIEAASSSLGGVVPPIRKYGGQPLLEKEAFSLQPGELSGIIQLTDKFVILYCEGYTRPVDVKIEEVRELLHEDIFEKKLRAEMVTYFEALKEKGEIRNVLAPERSTASVRR